MNNPFPSLIVLTGVAFAALSAPALAEVEPGQGFDVTSYELALTPDIVSKTVTGRQTVFLQSTIDGLQRLDFSGNALTIYKATVNGVAVRHGLEGNVLVFDLAEPFMRGTPIKLELSYHGRPARGFVGTTNLLYTSYFACDWMVCAQNAFGDKADFTLDLVVPPGVGSISLGKLISRRRGRDGSEIHRWKAPRPYSAYLFGFAIGQFASTSERLGAARLTYVSDHANAAELKHRFAGSTDIAAFFATRAGLPLPVSEYSQLLVEGDEAQEAATYSVVGTKALPPNPRLAAEDWAIAHELAHQWWGNLITCATLEDFWLNEGITTFMTAAWKEHRYGKAAYDAELQLARVRLARARAQGFDKPLAWEGSYPTLSTRRAVQYSKGALFMAHLRATLGEKAFWSGLRRYTRKHAGGTVISADFQRAMEASSGQDLNVVFTEWVFGRAVTERQLTPTS